ncbi:hypothetical protein V2J09_008219 [Rumex salicifolius]
MGSILFFLFFIQTMVFFEPLNIPDQKSDEDRHVFGGSNATGVNFPVDLDLMSLKKESDEKEAPKRASDKAKEEMNLELSLNSDVQASSSSSSSVKALNNGRVSSPAVKIINKTAVKKTVTHKKETSQKLVVMACMHCQVYVMTPWRRVCPRCHSPGLVDVKSLMKKTAVVKKEIKREEGIIKREEEEIKYGLVVMGCYRCYLYFMGIKEKPVCPNCNNNQKLIGLNIPSKM